MSKHSRVLLDTNVISETRRKKPDQAVADWFAAQRVTNLYLSSFTIAEIAFGIETHQQPEMAEHIRAWLEGTILPRFAGRILPFDTEAGLIYGRWVGQAQRLGKTVPATDAQIAAIAYTHGLSIVTRNVEDFQSLPVTIINPWALT
jgi:toxin FitB